jgi:hypothetical protein
MSIENQARSLMTRHQNLVRNRQQSLLNRVADEVGIDIENLGDKTQKHQSESRRNYDRSGSTMS